MIASFFLSTLNCFAFNEAHTHPGITKRAFSTIASALDTYLKDQLDFKSGINTIFVKQNMLYWFRHGSTSEDIPTCRAANHFHNPQLPWNQSQSTDLWPQDKVCRLLEWTPRYSNITWATGATAPDSAISPRNKQEMGFDDARRYFYNALTASDTTTRENYFVKTFQAVGQTLHLLQDMAVPAHVRNDFLSHLIWSGVNFSNILNPSGWASNPFEAYVKMNPSLITSISQIPQYAYANAKVTDFWDTNARGNVALSQGLAESTNTDYFSDFTIPGNPHVPFLDTHTFEYPQIPTYICQDNISGSILKRKYSSRVPCPTDGSIVDHFAAISMLTPRLLGTVPIPLPFINKYVLDDNVHKTYAQELLPRAIGYSTALLGYFFRGKIEVEPVTASSTLQHIHVKLRNATSTGEEMTSGEISLVIKYRIRNETDDHIISPPTTTSDYRYKIVQLSGQYTIPRDSQSEQIFALGDDPLPIFATDVTLQVVYRGQLGNEAGSVAVGAAKFDKYTSDMALSLPQSGVYALAAPDAVGFKRITLSATSHTELSQPDGVFELILQYRLATSDPFQGVAVETEPNSPDSFYIIRAQEVTGVTSLQRGVTRELVFDISTTPLPLWASDVYANVVYRNGLTLGDKALAMGRLDLAEPTPVDVFNNTDLVCINQQWYTAGSSEAIAAVGTDFSGAPLGDVFQHTISDIYYNVGSSESTELVATPTIHDLASATTVEPGQMRRLGYILGDYQFAFTADEKVASLDDRDDWILSFNNVNVPGDGFTNQQDRGISGMYGIRGNKMWGGAGIIYDNETYPADSPDCSWDALP